MNINFDRHRAQLRCETIMGCTIETWANANFKSLVLTAANASLLESDLKEDAADLYFKGILSLFESFRSINERLYSWATVKIYYSIFYLLKSHLAASGIALIRQKSLYCLKATAGETPSAAAGRKYNTDHSGTIYYFSNLISSDILLSQKIELMSSYEWLMNKREQINYRERIFNEPSHPLIWETIVLQSQVTSLKDIVLQYIKDHFILSFQEEHAILAIPIKRALLTKAKLDSERIKINFSNEKKQLLHRLLPFDIAEINELLD